MPTALERFAIAFALISSKCYFQRQRRVQEIRLAERVQPAFDQLLFILKTLTARSPAAQSGEQTQLQESGHRMGFDPHRPLPAFAPAA